MLGLMLKTPMGLFRGFLGVYRLVKKATNPLELVA